MRSLTIGNLNLCYCLTMLLFDCSNGPCNCVVSACVSEVIRITHSWDVSLYKASQDSRFPNQKVKSKNRENRKNRGSQEILFISGF
ncbi:hypothetical protein F5Y16DRAFT_249741 [Xylariaceae sp. FL0255]|nr:hypothetical protein F5Y16DRAFT_249741 [Xylariaceae sp. FL0255]